MAVPNGKVITAGDLGRALREHRKASGLKLVEAAGLSGVGVRFLSELERGKQTAALGKALKVLERMGLEVHIVPRGRKPK